MPPQFSTDLRAGLLPRRLKFFTVGGFLPPSRVFSPHGRHNFAREERVIPAAAIPQDWAGVRRSSNRCVGATIRLEKKLENTGYNALKAGSKTRSQVV
jgi:hypothetical protein